MATLVIRKYSNRRLYDTSSSRYVNLEDIAAAIRNGAEVQVLDAKTGQDLTRVVLTQIIVEDAREQPAGLPLELLRQLILASDRVRQEFMSWYLKSAFDAYHKVQNAIQSGFSEVQSAALSPLELMKRLVQPPPADKPAPNREVQRLRRRVAELEARLQSPKRRSGGRKSRP